MPERTSVVSGQSNIFAEDMRKLVNSKEFSDLKFVVGSQRKIMYAHRCVVMARCQVFRAMFSEQSQKLGKQDTETPLVLSDVNPDIFQAILEYLYTNQLSMSPRMAFDVMGTAIEYGLEDLQDSVTAFFLDGMSSETCCHALRTGVTFAREDLVTRALSFIEANTTSIVNEKAWAELAEASVVSILKSDKLNADELELVQAVRNWGSVNAIVQGKSAAFLVKKLVPHLRLTLLGTDELQTLEQENAKDQLLSPETLALAWRSHALKTLDENAVTRKGTKLRPHLKEYKK